MTSAQDNPPPSEMDGAKVVCFAQLGTLDSSGRTIHRINDNVQSCFSGCAIAAYPESSDFYLFYCGDDWQVITDTCHCSLKEAKEQAEFEYPGVRGRWHNC